VLAKNNKQQEIVLVSWLTDMRLKEKNGTYRTFVRMSVEDNLTVPMCVTGTKFPFGSLTNLETEAITVVKSEKEHII
jgi:hypothetical protein